MKTYTYIILDHDDYGTRVDIVEDSMIDTYRVPRGGYFKVGTAPVSPNDYATHGLDA